MDEPEASVGIFGASKIKCCSVLEKIWYCTLWWVDIGTEARVFLNVVVNLSKSMENLKKLV
jgi:hypothetical protein